MLHPNVLGIVLVICILIDGGASQICDKASIYADVVPLCADYLNNQAVQGEYVYIPAGSKFVVASIISNAGFYASRSIMFLPPECQRVMLPYVCRSVFPPCELRVSNITNSTVAVKKSLCYRGCLNVIKYCKASVPVGQLPNCSAIDSTSNQPTFPKKHSLVTVNQESFSVACIHSDHHIDPPPFPFECPFPLINFEKRYGIPPRSEWVFPFPCGLRCPSWILTSDLSEYHYFWNTRLQSIRVATAMQMFLTMLVLLLMLSGYRHWLKWPVCLLFALFFVTWISEFSFLIPAVGDIGWAGCRNPYTAKDTYDATCLFSGFFTSVIFGILMVWTWIVLNTLLYMLLPSASKSIFRTVEKCSRYIVAALIVAVIAVINIYALATNGYSGDMNCFLNDLTAVSIVLWVWMGLLITGFCAFLIMCAILLKTRGIKGLLVQHRLSIFTVIFGGVYATSTTSGIAITLRTDELEADVNQFLTCVVSTWVASETTSARNNTICQLSKPLEAFYNMQFYQYFSNNVPLLIFLIIFWWELLRHFFTTTTTTTSLPSGITYHTKEDTNGKSDTNVDQLFTETTDDIKLERSEVNRTDSNHSQAEPEHSDSSSENNSDAERALPLRSSSSSGQESEDM